MKWGIYRNEMSLLNLRKQSNEQLLRLIHSFRKKLSDCKITRVTQSIRYLRGRLDNACSTLVLNEFPVPAFFRQSTVSQQECSDFKGTYEA